MTLNLLLIILCIHSLKSDICPKNKWCTSCINDECLSCIYSYYSTKSKKCLLPKIFIKHCNKYVNKYVCKECEKGYYVKEGECVRIKLHNCIYYSELN